MYRYLEISLPASSPPPRRAAPILQKRLKLFQTKVRLFRSKLYSSSFYEFPWKRAGGTTRGG